MNRNPHTPRQAAVKAADRGPAQRQLQQLGPSTQHANGRLHARKASRGPLCVKEHTPSKQHTPRTEHTLKLKDVHAKDTPGTPKPNSTRLVSGRLVTWRPPLSGVECSQQQKRHAHAPPASPQDSGCTAHRQRKTTQHTQEEAWCSPPSPLPPFRGCSCKGTGARCRLTQATHTTRTTAQAQPLQQDLSSPTAPNKQSAALQHCCSAWCAAQVKHLHATSPVPPRDHAHTVCIYVQTTLPNHTLPPLCDGCRVDNSQDHAAPDARQLCTVVGVTSARCRTSCHTCGNLQHTNS